MKSAKDSIRRSTSDHDDSIRKSAKLDPFNRSGKDRHHLYKSLSKNDDDEDEEYTPNKRESVLDYFDDGDDEN